MTTEEEHYFKGWSENIGTTYETIGTIAFPEIFLPTADQSLQISSSDSADTSVTVLVKGYDDTFTAIQEIIATNAVDGQIAVALTTSFFRINSMRVVSPVTNAGDIYLTKAGASLYSGVPSVNTDYIYSIHQNETVGAILNGCIPPIVDGILQPNYVLYSISNGSGMYSQIVFQMKYTNSSNWGTEFNFYIDARSNSQFTWRLDGVADIPNNDLAKGFDVRVKTKKTINIGYLHVSSSLSINQTTTT